MRITQLLPLAGLGSAFVVPDGKVFAEIAVEKQADFRNQWHGPDHKDHGLQHRDHFQVPKALREGVQTATNILDHIFNYFDETVNVFTNQAVPGFDITTWLESGKNLNALNDDTDHPHPPHGRPPHGKPPHKRPGKHHPPHHHNSTIWQLISSSKYSTKFAKLIEEADLVDILNSTKANVTVFVPTDKGFPKLPEDAPKPSKEFLQNLVLYHITPGLNPAGYLLYSHTVPTLYNETHLGDKPQRLSIRASLRGVLVNFYSKVLFPNIPAKNGLVHAIASPLIPPPSALKIIELLPSEFSQLLLALEKTGLAKTLTDAETIGGTFFAPPNSAFKKLGHAANAFLFSERGEKYLKALLQYHVVENQTLYSNAYYGPSKSDVNLMEDAEADAVPYYHFDLPTLLKDKALAVDVVRYGPFISMKVNGLVRIVVEDGIAKDGVIQVPSNILIPPRKTAGLKEVEHWDGTDIEVEELKERLSPFVADGSVKLDL